jgi:hypothetical protein
MFSQYGGFTPHHNDYINVTKLNPQVSSNSVKRVDTASLHKGKVFPGLFLSEHHVMEAYWGRGGIAPRILDFGTRWR